MITIAFFSYNTTISNIIKWFENSPYSHSAIGFTKDGQQYWLQALQSGVTITPRTSVSGLAAEFQVLPDITNEVVVAEKKVGEKYSDLTLVGFALMIIAKWFGIGIDNPFYEKSAVVCSEFIIEADAQHQIPEFVGLKPANISPSVLFDICSSGKSFKRLS